MTQSHQGPGPRPDEPGAQEETRAIPRPTPRPTARPRPRPVGPRPILPNAPEQGQAGGAQPQQSAQGQPFAQPTPQPSGPKPGPPRGAGPAPSQSAPVPAPSGTSHAPSAAPTTGQSPAQPPAPISPQPQRDMDPRRPHFVTYPIPVATTEHLPGREIAEVLGVVIGVATRPRDMAHNPEMGFVNTAARQDAVGALVQQAREAGADAVVGVRFDGGKISDTVTELTAYGTAVKLRSAG